MKHLFILLAIALLPACATVTKGTTDEVVIHSEPSGSKVTTTLGYQGITPAKIEHKRKKTFTATIENEGYKSAQIFIDTRLAGSGTAGFKKVTDLFLVKLCPRLEVVEGILESLAC